MTAEVTAESAGSQPQELGRDVLTFQREDGIAENFHTEQSRPLLEQLATETGGRYRKPSELKNLPRDISYSEAGSRHACNDAVCGAVFADSG